MFSIMAAPIYIPTKNVGVYLHSPHPHQHLLFLSVAPCSNHAYLSSVQALGERTTQVVFPVDGSGSLELLHERASLPG